MLTKLNKYQIVPLLIFLIFDTFSRKGHLFQALLLHRLKSRDIGRKLETDRKEEEDETVENSSYNELDLNHVKTTNEQINGVTQSRIFNLKQG